MAERDDDERQDRHQRAMAAGLGAGAGLALGGLAGGPGGAAAGLVAGAALGPELEPLVKGLWAELWRGGQQNQVDVLVAAIHAGISVDEMQERINASERTRLLTGYALSAASRTAWEDKVRTLGRSLASGLLADDNAKIDTEQMIIAAITDIEGPQLALLELLVCWRPVRYVAEPMISGPLDIPGESHSRTLEGSWDVNWREWPRSLVAYARPNLVPILASLLGSLQRHGLVVQNDNTGEALERYSGELADVFEIQYYQDSKSGAFVPTSVPKVRDAADLAPEPMWSPTELGEQVFLRFRDAGTDLPDVWTTGPADQQE